MSNGVAYVLDADETLPTRYNPEMVKLERVMDTDDLEQLYALVREHFEKTGSPRAQEIMDTWDYYRALFWKVTPLPPDVVKPAAEQAGRQIVRESGLAERR
jgi:glutamate synthase (ferredoxin)